MAVIEKFLGRRVEIPEDRKYSPEQGLWLKPEGASIVCGLSLPALILAGGVNSLDWLVDEGAGIDRGEAVVFAITGKIMYINAPLSGIVTFNRDVKDAPATAASDPYGKGWLFAVRPNAGAEKALEPFLDDQGYLESLKGTEGFKNPDGVKGGVSGMCKAVYSGIREQGRN